MENQFTRWYETISKRRSRRKYDSRPVEPHIISSLENTCDQFRPFEEARAVLVRQPADKVFNGVIGSYGKIKGAPLFLAFIGDASSPYINEKVGYNGEGLILEATALNLATCWVGGLFSEAVVNSLVSLKAGEKVLAVSPIGYPVQGLSFEEKMMTGFGRNHRRKPLSELVSGSSKGFLPDWVAEALEAARLSPSALNRQPWRFRVEPNSITVSVDGEDTHNISKRLDCGIAMLHVHTVAAKFGFQGIWDFLDYPEVSRFKLIRE